LVALTEGKGETKKDAASFFYGDVLKAASQGEGKKRGETLFADALFG